VGIAKSAGRIPGTRHQKHVRRQLLVIRQFVGHGIGRQMHEDPQCQIRPPGPRAAQPG